MKLIIVDDEKLTREGLRDSYKWEALGVSQIYEADDGLNGLHIVIKEKPDIILTDVRMPRMNGIELAERVSELLPDSSIIFMSGYSDKKYLRAAIKLKAVSYIEKPINPKDVKEAILESTKRINQTKLNKQTMDINRKEAVSELVQNLNYLNSKTSYPTLLDQMKGLGFNISSTTFFNTIIIKLVDSVESLSELTLKNLEDYITKYLDDNLMKDISYIHTRKQSKFLVFHLFYETEIKSDYMQTFFQKLSMELSNICNFHISIGNKVVEIDNVYESYNTAVITLQNAFFHDINSVLFYKYTDEFKDTTIKLPDNLNKDFEIYLKEKDQEALQDFLDDLYENLKGSHNILAIVAKEFYYKLIIALEETWETYQLPSLSLFENDHNILSRVMSCDSLDELHSFLVKTVEEFMESLRTTKEGNINVVYMKKYISENYRNSNLSIKSISDYIGLSPSYTCTIFKTETNQTLNQYISLYRIEKAKTLLLDPRKKIIDISYETGYTDSNYFSKSFRKIVGSSPTEFRENHIK